MSETRKFNAKKYSECFKRFSDLVAFSRLDEYDCDEISKMLELLFETISELNNRVSQLETENNLIKLEVKALKAQQNTDNNLEVLEAYSLYAKKLGFNLSDDCPKRPD